MFAEVTPTQTHPDPTAKANKLLAHSHTSGREQDRAEVSWRLLQFLLCTRAHPAKRNYLLLLPQMAASSSASSTSCCCCSRSCCCWREGRRGQGIAGDGVDVLGYRSMHEKLLVMMMKNVKSSKSANGKRCSESALVVVVVKGRRIASQPGHAHSTLMMIKCAAEA